MVMRSTGEAMDKAFKTGEHSNLSIECDVSSHSTDPRGRSFADTVST
jgi:hypothetical protein